MSKPVWMGVLYGVMAVLNLGLVALYGQIQAGNVPFPTGWEWLAPVISAMLVGATALLPRVQDVRRD
jgi:hypothetical protein